jgi:hypothetical protein
MPLVTAWLTHHSASTWYVTSTTIAGIPVSKLVASEKEKLHNLPLISPCHSYCMSHYFTCALFVTLYHTRRHPRVQAGCQ